MEQTTQQTIQKPPFPIKTKIAACWMITGGVITGILGVVILIVALIAGGTIDEVSAMVIAIGILLFFIFLISFVPGMLILKRKKWAWVFSVFLLSILCYFCIKLLFPIDFLVLLFLVWNLVPLCLLLYDRKNFFEIIHKDTPFIAQGPEKPSLQVEGGRTHGLSKTNWKFLLIVVVLAVIVGGGVLVYSKKINKEIISSSQTPEIKLPEKVKDETADWPTYRNDYWGFEFKYPSSDAAEISLNQLRGNGFNLSKCTRLRISSSNLTLEQYLVREWGPLTGPQRIISVGGEKAIKFTHTNYEGTEITYIYLSKDGTFYEFTSLPEYTKCTNASGELVILDNIISTFKFLNLKPPENLAFTPLSSPSSPSFIELLNDAKDVKINFHYEGDYAGSYWGYEPEFYTPEGSSEKYLNLSKIKKEEGQYVYGPDYYSIFTAEESHVYQGTPIFLSNPNSKYSVSYVGFKINNRDLISELKIEFGVDYNNGGSETLGCDKQESSIFASIFGVQMAYACGPGLYLRQVGNSNLTFVEESNGIAWYRLEKPVNLYDISLNYCDSPPAPDYCNNMADDPEECWDYCWYNASISSLKNGNLRTHIYYKPNDKEGFLKFQIVNLILSDSGGAYYQPIMGDNFDHYYRAYLH